jgi:dihydrofolate synthase/folylpolyglutamate synthase
MNIQESLNKLFALHTFGVKLGLENIRKFLDHIGNPQEKLKTIHIAGSNGKGSTSSFIASILMEQGYLVGLYTSPHFVKFNERISINGKMIPDDYVAQFFEKYEDFINKYQLTFFEVTTAMAFNYFYDSEVDYAVIETGLGGRLDATNVLNPLACVITSISLEHTNILGDKIENIAYEKSEIIKSGSKTFIGLLDEKSDAIIEKKCLEVKSPLFRLLEYINEKNDNVQLYTEEIEFDDWQVPLKGKFQKYNAALAALAVTKTFDVDDPSIITKGIANVVKNTKLQGRYEVANVNPDLILDSAHNPAGIKCFIDEFKVDRKKYQHTTLLFGAMRDKNINDMLIQLKDYFDEIILTDINYERAASIEHLKEIADNIKLSYKVNTNKKEIIKNHLKGDKNNCLAVAGSMYLLGEIKSILSTLDS